jgi:hypothetical protein
MTEDAGYSIHSHTLEKALTFIMREQIFNRGRPVNISQRWAAQLCKMSTRTWRRACLWLVEHDLIYRSPRRGKGPGSLFAVKWERVHLWMFSYSNNGQKKGSRAISKGHLWPAGNTRNGFMQDEMRTRLRIENMAKMNPNPPTEDLVTAGLTPSSVTHEKGGGPAANIYVNDRPLRNVSLSSSLFESIGTNPEFLALALDRGMVCWDEQQGGEDMARAAMEAVRAVLDGDTRRQRYLDAVKAKEGGGRLGGEQELVDSSGLGDGAGSPVTPNKEG